MRRVRTIALVSGLMSMILSGSAVAAQAATSEPNFAAQAKAAGLTGAQAKELQKEVDAIRADTGGTQVAINKIDLKGVGNILLSLPGQSVAYEVDSIGQPPQVGAATCPAQTFCAFAGPGATGNRLNLFTCKTWALSKATNWFTGSGSYINNQTTGTRAVFVDSNYNAISLSVAAQAPVTPINWSPIRYVVPCIPLA
ncbi:peptidase inhibitor family I36 protein [Micromonospora endophytica]|uniref:peptidase inhibitor family I36 protein n=1 Tax=Micromonospora endophytica TaxID=515350 RepID=UPI0011B6F7A9|nr:peptidase inhibitor family I36 protein [Micromonospora endophytica]BCJ56830.1 hypothetical protein Jiend_02520 [Micromonospora endophytica]